MLLSRSLLAQIANVQEVHTVCMATWMCPFTACAPFRCTIVNGAANDTRFLASSIRAQSMPRLERFTRISRLQPTRNLNLLYTGPGNDSHNFGR